MKLFFVTGSSGVGKTTILPLLKAGLPENFVAHDFDERLTKEVGRDNSLLDAWRYKTTKYWIDVAQMNAVENKNTVVLGLVYPSEVVQIKSQIECKMCLLDVSDEVIKERLMGKRFNSGDKIAGLKQGTGKTPEEFIEENKILMQKLRDEILLLNGSVIDTTNLTVEQTTEKLLDWILKK